MNKIYNIINKFFNIKSQIEKNNRLLIINYIYINLNENIKIIINFTFQKLFKLIILKFSFIKKCLIVFFKNIIIM